jgi:glycerate kinase
LFLDGGRLYGELNYLDQATRENQKRTLSEKLIADNRLQNTTQYPDDTVDPVVGTGGGIGGGLSGGFTLFIQTALQQGDTVLTQEQLLQHASLQQDIANLQIDMFG